MRGEINIKKIITTALTIGAIVTAGIGSAYAQTATPTATTTPSATVTPSTTVTVPTGAPATGFAAN